MTAIATPALSLGGSVAVVTGALGLLGRHHCRALARAGANVIVADLDAGGCERFARDLDREFSREAMGVGLDICDRESIVRLREAVLRRFQRLDVLVNNAAVNEKVEDGAAGGDRLRFEHYSLALWERAFAVNVTGTFLCCQVLGGEMAMRRQGRIVNVASTYALVAPDQRLYQKADGTQDFYKSAAYPATKGAVVALTRFLAAYWGEAGVRVNALCPGGVENGQDPEFVARYSDRTPLRRMASPSDYEGALVFLASEASAYMTGANLVVDGGWTAW
jgi:NAD(P)-dependent dehydrogenase (short-subunit alcohol dehydrogenase family)